MNSEHYYLTRLLALRSGMSEEDSTLLAWANYNTDKMTSWEQGFVSQVYNLNALDGLVQRLILSSFHFFPSGKDGDPWVVGTKPNKLILRYFEGGFEGKFMEDVPACGIALHALHDSFTHAGFRSIEDDRNGDGTHASLPPLIGHAWYDSMPDQSWLQWKNQNEESIDNPSVFLAACRATWGLLSDEEMDAGLQADLLEAFKTEWEGARVQRYHDLCGDQVNFAQAHARLWPLHRRAWISAAKAHLAWSVAYLPLEEEP